MRIRVSHAWRTAAAMMIVGAASAGAQTSTTVVTVVTPPPFRVLIDGNPAGTATSATNLPTDTVVLHQHIDSTVPTKQAMSGEQANVVITTSDPALVGVVQAWVNANNSGTKNTVQRKMVEIDRATPAGGLVRYRLYDAWPTHIDNAGGVTAVTFVYQRLDVGT